MLHYRLLNCRASGLLEQTIAPKWRSAAWIFRNLTWRHSVNGAVIREPMAAFDEYTDVVTDEQLWALYILGHRYVLPNGQSVRVPQSAAWCYDCETVVAAERIPDNFEIEHHRNELLKTLAGIKTNLSFLFDDLTSVQAELEMQEALWAAFSSRTTPAQCLTCFGTRLFSLQFQLEDETHVPNGPRLRYTSHGMADCGIEKVLTLDIHGNKIG